MSTTYFGFAFSGQMLGEGYHTAAVRWQRVPLPVAREILAAGVVSCANPTHRATVEEASRRLGVAVPVCEGPAPKVRLLEGDRLLVLQVGGLLPRETREFTAEELGAAELSFQLWTVEGTEAGAIG